MATHTHGFEQFDPQVPPPAERFLEIVQAPTPEEIPEILNAGAGIVVCQDFETRIIEDDKTFGGSYADHNRPISVIYVAASQDQIGKLVASGYFEANWEMDPATYAPYVCLKSRDKENLASVFGKLNTVFGEQAKLDTGGNYAWNKNQAKKEGGGAAMQ